ncbi:MAG: hypothetical protein KC609_08795, partial [Myxococcales bacterium]|nr:hypothetical protein [Myxococcales bacterium]
MRATFSRNQLERIAERYLEQTRASGIAVFVTQAAAHFGIALDFYLGDESPLMRHMLPLTILRTERAAASRIEYIQIGHSADDLDRRRIGKIPESAMICIARDGEVRGGILLVNLPTTHERARLDRLLLHTHNALASALILRTCEIAFEPLAPIIAGLEPLAVYSRERTIVLGAS